MDVQNLSYGATRKSWNASDNRLCKSSVFAFEISYNFKCCHSVLSNSATPWTIVYHAPLFMEFSRQEYWSGLPFSSPGDLPNPGIEPRLPELQADSLLSEPPVKQINSVMGGKGAGHTF